MKNDKLKKKPTMVRVIKKEEDLIHFQQPFVNITEKEEIHTVSDFIPFQQTFVNISDTKKEEIHTVSDFIPFQQTFVNISDTKKGEIHTVSDFSESDPLNTNNFKPNSSGRKKKHFCSNCSASFRATHELSDHMKSIHKGLRPYNCLICDSKFSYKKNLKYHEKAVHKIGKSSK